MKALNVIKKIIVGIVALIAVCMMVFTIVSVAVFDRTDRSLFGYRAFIVLSDSMSATDFNAGDLIFSKTVDPTTLQAGDIISYVSQNDDNFGEVVTHKIRTLTVDNNGNPGFITYGTTTNTDDEGVVTYQYILGKYVGHIPGVGKFFNFLKTVPGYIVCILVPFLVLIIIEGVRVISLFKRYKKEQQAAIDEERKQVEKEREENQKMMQELLAMKDQMMQGRMPQGNAPQNSGQQASKYAPQQTQPHVYDEPFIYDDSVSYDNQVSYTGPESNTMDPDYMGQNNMAPNNISQNNITQNNMSPNAVSQNNMGSNNMSQNNMAPNNAASYELNGFADHYEDPQEVYARQEAARQEAIRREMYRQQRMREMQQRDMRQQQQLTPEQQQRMREFQQMTPEQRQRMSQAQQRMTPEMQQRMRELQRQRAQVEDINK